MSRYSLDEVRRNSFIFVTVVYKIHMVLVVPGFQYLCSVPAEIGVNDT